VINCRTISGTATLLSLFLAAACAQTADPAASLDSLDRHFAQQLTVLAEKCDSLQLAEQAKITREWQVPRTRGRHTLFIPLPADLTEPPAGAPDLVKRWHAKFRELRIAQAASLFGVAQEYLSAGDASRAYQLLHEVLRENPDHEQARQALGYTKQKNSSAWSSHLPPPKAEVGRTNHPKTGWQTGKYWRVETPHWRIATNHSPAAGVELAKKLEDFHLLWRQLFFDYWCTKTDLQAALAGGSPLPEPKTPMNVYLFKNRDEYVKFLAPGEPAAALTRGYYSAEHRVALFYAGDDTVQPTWFHEAAHQLFQQWRDAPQGIGEKHNFWLVEGAAIYVESLQNHGSHWTAGGWQADRLQIPRYRALSGEKMLPLQQLVALGREKVQADRDNIGKLYGQFAAKAHFLLDHPDPGYRQAACALLRELYAQRDKLTSLTELTGVSLEELDQAALQSLQVTDDDLLTTPGLSRLRNLSLGRTQVTEKGLSALRECRELRWLELTALPVTDGTLTLFKGCTNLEQLYLDGTKITSASLPQIATFASLEELDLSNTAVSDEGLAALGRLRKLRTLYLTGSQVTPAGIKQLKTILPKTDIQ
jgi:hypothetical protein